MNSTERELLDAIENPAFVLERDEQGRPIYVAFNQIACSISQFEQASVIGQTALTVYPGEFGRIAYDRHCRVFASGEAEIYELTLPFKTGVRHVRTHLKPISDNAGRVLKLVGTSRDITAEYSVRETRANSIVLNTELENFINLAAHDLRSPVRNIRFLADMLRDECEDMSAESIGLIDKLETVAELAMKMINDVLSHAEITGVSESLEVFELSALCQEILQVLDPQEVHSAQVQFCQIVGDKITTQVVLRNLIDNAIKHNPGKSVSLSISAASPEAGQFEIAVQDDGVGFADPTIAFLDNGELRRENGFGLLGIRRLVNARNGKISAAKKLMGDGATVTLNLPGNLIGSDAPSASAD